MPYLHPQVYAVVHLQLELVVVNVAVVAANHLANRIDLG